MSKSSRRLKRSKGAGGQKTGSQSKYKAALEPFASLCLPSGEDGEDIYIYVGQADELGEKPHLRLEDFRRAARVVR